jgi:transcriptional regulator MraZ
MATKRKPNLRGSSTATVDQQGRLKIPTKFKEILVKSYGYDFFITSLTGDNVFAYPLSVWEAHEERLIKTASLNSPRRKYLDRVNYYGLEVSMDRQGRILIPATLRDSAAIQGELRVIGKIDHLDIWNEQRFARTLKEETVTEEDLIRLSDLGI